MHPEPSEDGLQFLLDLPEEIILGLRLVGRMHQRQFQLLMPPHVFQQLAGPGDGVALVVQQRLDEQQVFNVLAPVSAVKAVSRDGGRSSSQL